MSEKMKEQLEKLASIAGKFPDEETAKVGMDRTADFLAGAQAMASAMQKAAQEQ